MTQDWLTELERLARGDGNPVYAWEAVAHCERPSDLPAWVFEYLQGAATRLITLDPNPKTLAADVLQALWLSGDGGPSALRRAETAKRKRAALDFMADQVPVVGVSEAATAAAEKYGLAASTLKGYWYEKQRGAA